MPLFKSWVPDWFIKFTIFIVVLPTLLLFNLSLVNVNAATGYYGIEPADVQYSMIVFYVALVSYISLEKRFFVFVAAKEYFIVGTLIQMLAAYVCFRTSNFYVLLVFRFIQGMANCGTTSISLNLIFSRLHSDKAREIGYSVFYGMLVCMAPMSMFLTSSLIDTYDFRFLYKAAIFCYIPGAVILYNILNTVRLHKRIPLYQLDWASFIIYSSFLCLLGYIFIYGQQYLWFEDQRIVWSTVAMVSLLGLHLFRQRNLKRPAHDLRVFNFKNFLIGIFLMFVLYVSRGSLNIATQYFGTALKMDPIHIGKLMAVNIVGIVLGVIISSRMLLSKRPLRLILIYGFVFLLVFHVMMSFLFDSVADASSFIVPLTLQGLGAGMLMTPIIIFSVSAVPQAMANTASGITAVFRFIGFCTSIALINYFSLYRKTDHINRLQGQLSTLNAVALERLAIYKQMFVAKGIPEDQAVKMSNKMLSESIDIQAQLQSAVDYFNWIGSLLVLVVLIVALIPFIHRTIINLKSRLPVPISY